MRSASQPPRSGLEIIEEATRLLRSCSALPYVCFYTGTLPFVLAALYFWADMSRSADASSRCATSAFFLALLYFWMRGWQSLFLHCLRNEMEGRGPSPISVKGFLTVVGRQMGWQALALLSLPLALILTLPFGWVFAFHQHITVLAGEGPDSPPLFQTALKEAARWPGQNHALLLLLFIFALLVGLNVGIALLQLPSLLKILFGIDLLIGRSFSTALNTTFLAAVLGVTYLLLDPLVKACYLLRSFYEQSIKSGADLRAQLRKLNLSVVGIALLFFFMIPSPASAAENESANKSEPNAPQDSPSYVRPVSAPELDRALENTIAQREYRWRLPREKKQEAEEVKEGQGFFQTIWSHIKEAFTYLLQGLKNLVKKIIDAIERAVAWIQGKFNPKKTPSAGGAWDFSSATFWKFLSLALAGIGGGLLFLYLYRQRKIEASRTGHTAELMPALPDLTDEQVTADELSEESWLKLATSLADQGDLRLAVRALYLASLSHLASREMIRITKFKTNRDYQTEVQRRARTQAELQAAFSENLNIFEQSWYGMHEITADLIETFRANLQRIKTC